MRRALFAALLFGLSSVGACATDDGYTRHHVDVVSKSEAVAESAEGKQLEDKFRTGVTGEPVTSTSFAMRLGELALRERGLDPSERGVGVSFCEGLYTVTFERPADHPTACDWVVCIEAASSRIVSVKTQ